MIAVFEPSPNAVTYHRLQPWLLLPDTIRVTEMVELDEMGSALKAVVMNGSVKPFEGFSFFDFRRMLDSKGIYLILDVDDHWDLYTNHILRKGDWVKNTLPLHLQTIAAAHILTTTHEHLADALQKVNPLASIAIVPNAINFSHLQWRDRPEPIEGLSLGYLGGRTHEDDLKSMRYDFRGFQGMCADYYKRMFPTWEQFEHTPFTDYGYHYERFSVALAPLVLNKFNQYKSDLKAVEAGAKGCGLIVSRMRPYTGFVDSFLNEDNCWFIDRPDGWRNTARRLRTDIDEVRVKAANLSVDVRRLRSIEKVNVVRGAIAAAVMGKIVPLPYAAD